MILAHRGNHELKGGSIDNTIESLDNAAHDGHSDAVEMDFQPLGDGTLVVYHDSELADGSRQGTPLSDLGRDDIETPEYAKIPTLEEWAEHAGSLGVNVMAEFKGHGFEQEAIETLQRYIRPHHLATWSFDRDALSAVHAIDPTIPQALVIDRDDDAGSPAEQVDSLGYRPQFVEVVDENVNEDVLDDMTARGIGVLVGESDGYRQSQLFRDDRISGIVTSYVTQADDLRDGRTRAVWSPITGTTILPGLGPTYMPLD